MAHQAGSVPLVLASASPRRRELLAGAGLRFAIEPSEIDESQSEIETPVELVERLAREKALDVALRHAHSFVLGADTIVALDDAVLGKPRDAGHALELLLRLEGRTHCVLTGVAVVAPDGALHQTSVASRVTFRPASRSALERYVAAGESLDKAGGYALQGSGRELVERVEGSESNVIGLPLVETLALLRRAGYPIPSEDAP